MNSADVKNTLLACKLVADLIKEAGEIPAGHLYALLMPQGCSLQTFEYIIGMFTSDKHAKPLVTRRGDLLIWNG